MDTFHWWFVRGDIWSKYCCGAFDKSSRGMQWAIFAHSFRLHHHVPKFLQSWTQAPRDSLCDWGMSLHHSKNISTKSPLITKLQTENYSSRFLIKTAMQSISFHWKKQHLSGHKLISDNRTIQNKLFLFQEKHNNSCVEALECHDSW